MKLVKWNVKKVVVALATMTLIPALMLQSASADYPKKPVTLVSPYGAGGAADLAARTISANAANYLGEGILVVNRTGAAGITGSTSVVKSTPDGYTLLLARVGSQAVVPALNRTIPYKWDDFTMLGLIELNPFALVVNADSPYKTLDDIKAAAAAGTKLSYSSAGVGTLQHVAMAMVLDEFGMSIDAMKHVPYKGGGKAAAAVVGGHVDIFFQNLSGVIGNIQAGKLRAIVVSTPERVPSIGDVPTVAEAGYPGLETIVGWSGIWGPPNLPEAVVTKWVSVLENLKTDKAWNTMTTGLGSIPSIRSPADTKIFVEKQYLAFKTLTEKLGMTIE
jgi:tripartite-type tricarboxylate transporter receptor subunit TctC